MATGKLRFSFALLVVLAAINCGRAQENTVDEPPRVVSLAPHLTELAFEAGIGDLLVGVVEWSDYPAAARDLPRIGDAFRFDLERILRMEATHALAWGGGTPPGAIARLRELGLEVDVIEIGTLKEIGRAIERLGQLGAKPAKAAEKAAAFRRRLQHFEQDASGGQPLVEIFYQVSQKPLFTLGGRHVINEVFGLCGARNLFGDLDTEAASVDLEAVLVRDPLAIVIGENGGKNNGKNGDESGTKGQANAPTRWQMHPDLRAVACDNIMHVDPALLVRPTPRVLNGAATLCEWLEREVRSTENPACRIADD